MNRIEYVFNGLAIAVIAFFVVLVAQGPAKTSPKIRNVPLESLSQSSEPAVGSWQAELRQLSRRTPSPVKRHYSNPMELNRSNWLKIKTGMTMNEVRWLIGAPDSEVARNQIGNISTVVYVWQGDGLANTNIIFQNGRVVQKAQFGL